MTEIDRLDLDGLSAYLRRHLPDLEGEIAAEKFAGGQSNPTFLITAGARKLVLRRKPPGKLLKSAHAVDREFRVISALSKTDVPVATPVLLCEDDNVIGDIFFMMSYEDGDIFWDPALPEVTKPARTEMYSAMTRTLAALHSVDVAMVGMQDFGKSGDYYQRQLSRWRKQYRAAETDSNEHMEQLMEWLGSNLPEKDEETSLIHGDYRLDNLIFYRGQPRVRAILDWELSTLGHPIADFAYYCMSMRLPHGQIVGGLRGVDLDALGIPSEKQIIDEYCEIRGLKDVANWDFAISLSFFRLASIAQGVYARALAGNASNKNAMKLGGHVDPIARLALDDLSSVKP
ncbi:MAG: phosphotransferase family protein [Roseovarius sp.]|nr:phosphotransferase family protein [Roseovarius sp.]MCY4290803.1 phosphotransferase family protein [Roseovarius sp.]MCY4315321.1 phosphotransferase family protein [Roseovarius sp.]